MKILHICTQDDGGAGIAAYRLHAGLKSVGVQSKMLVIRRTSSDNDVIVFKQNENILQRFLHKRRGHMIFSEFKRYSGMRPEGQEIYSDDRSLYNLNKHPLIKDADIINLHWVARMVNYTEFFPNIINKPIVWTLHDMNPFTGGCHYAGDCVKYRTVCGACPQLGSTDINDLSERIWLRKKKCYKGQKIRIIAPSRWLADCARRSQLFNKFKVDIIPYGLSTSIFTKRDKQYSRELLGLPKNKVIILFGAQTATTVRKGAAYLMASLRLLRKKVDTSKIALAVFGRNSDAFTEDFGLPVYSIGSVQDTLLLSVCYSAADIFVLPSLEDNLPNTILESMACETPIVGFDTGGIPDMVRPGETGLLAEKRDTEDLAEKIRWMIDHPEERTQMGSNARELIKREYTTEIQAKNYSDLYESILAMRKT